MDFFSRLISHKTILLTETELDSQVIIVSNKTFSR
jgi:hypothetical protein